MVLKNTSHHCFFILILWTATLAGSWSNALIFPSIADSRNRFSSSRRMVPCRWNQPHTPLFRSSRMFIAKNDVGNPPPSSSSPSTKNSIDWVNFGFSFVYLSHFSSLYTQLPGLFGSTGLLPIADRIAWTDGWILGTEGFPSSPELGMELFCFIGIVCSAFQIILPQLRYGLPGIATYATQWILWHDLVMAGGRFTQYQMDTILLDAAPISLIAAASSLVPTTATAANYGYRWLLSRLYLGAGAVKLLSCDESWRNLSAIHWHLQSQPLPNFLGSLGYNILDDSITHVMTVIVLIVEMMAPFLFLTPLKQVRIVAFIAHIFLMAGIMLFGNFGSLQLFLIVIGLSLLDDLPPAPGAIGEGKEPFLDEGGYTQILTSIERETGESEYYTSENGMDKVVLSPHLPQDGNIVIVIVSGLALALAAGAVYWSIANIGTALCGETLSVAPLVYDLLLLALVVALVSPRDNDDWKTIALSLLLLAGSATPLSHGLGIPIPQALEALDIFNVGAHPYGLFAVITGVGGGTCRSD